MAIHANSTPAPAVQHGSFANAVAVPTPDLTPETIAMLDAIGREPLLPSAELSPTVRRKEIYEALHPETRAETFHGNRHTGSRRQNGDDQKSERFTASTAKATGRSERTVQRDAERGEKISERAAPPELPPEPLLGAAAFVSSGSVPAHMPLWPYWPSTAPHTSMSDGYGPPWCDFETTGDLADLDLARRRYLRRYAADAVDHLIALLDALDGDHKDMEEDDFHEEGSDDELSLGWRCHASEFQYSLGVGQQEDELVGDDEPMLGAPERHPSAYCIAGCQRTLEGSQTHWSAGRCGDGANDGESEPGYDLPEGDDELCGSDDVDYEPILAAPENHDEAPDQERWAQGYNGGAEPEADGIDDCQAYLSMQQFAANAAAARDALRRVEAIRRRKHWRATVARDPDEIEPSNLRLVPLMGYVR